MQILSWAIAISLSWLWDLPFVPHLSPYNPYYADLIKPSVELDYGTFHGVQDNNLFISWKGVKYADSPRFQKPRMPPKKNQGDVSATAFAKACLSGAKKSPGKTMTEHCLYANIYVPAGTRKSSSLPVVAWFHGGGFTSGNTQGAVPDLLFNTTDSPFILASFAYRLGPFGFLGGKEIEAGGDFNVGLRDQRAALEWVNKYIGEFGGNPKKVTVWGQSAGAGSALFHLILEDGKDQGLFRAAIGDSPPDVYQPDKDDGFVQTLFNEFALNAGCAVADPLACLQNATVKTLMTSSVKTVDDRAPALYPFQPFVDREFVTQTVSSALNNGRYVNVPVLFGGNTDDGANWASTVAEPNATIDTVYEFIRGQFPNMTRSTFEKVINEHYPLSDYNSSLVDLTKKMYGEARFICTSLFVSGVVSRDEDGYNYIYDNPDSNGLTRHGADLTAFFNTTVEDPSGLFFQMQKSWTSFITSKSPKHSWEAVDNDIGSPRLLLHPGEVANLDVDSGLEARCDFWRSTDAELQR